MSKTQTSVPAGLDPECNLFGCDRCGHKAGDPRDQAFRARCPGCGFLTKFYRLIQ